MVVTETAKNRIRDLISNDISSMALGTNGTDPTSADSALGSIEVSTQKSVLVEKTNKTITVTHNLDTTEGNGVTFKEGGVFINSDTVLLDRFVFPDFTKSSDLELTTIDIIRID